jgi:hypothetical protein
LKQLLLTKLYPQVFSIKSGYTKLMLFLLSLLVVLEAGDGICTYSAISKNLAREANPLMQNLAGTDNFLVLKISGAIICALLLWLLYRRFPRISLIASSCIVIFYAGVLTWNLNILL